MTARSIAQGITVNPETMGGVPCIAGTRIPARAIYNFARAGYQVDRIISEYPSLSYMQIANALAWCVQPLSAQRGLADG